MGTDSLAEAVALVGSRGSARGTGSCESRLSVTHVEAKCFLRGAQPCFSAALSGFFSHFPSLLLASPALVPRAEPCVTVCGATPTPVSWRQVLRPQLLSQPPSVTGEEGWGLAPSPCHGGGGLQAVALLACGTAPRQCQGWRDHWVASRALKGEVRKQTQKGRETRSLI